MEQNGKIVNRYNEKQAKTYNGFVMLVAVLLVIAAGIALMVLGIVNLVQYSIEMGSDEAVRPSGLIMLLGGIIIMVLGFILCAGFKVINPNEAVVLTLFGKYYEGRLLLDQHLLLGHEPRRGA